MTDHLAPLVKTRDLSCPPQTAFTLFTDRMGEWWPVASHSVAGDRVRSLVVEPAEGGHVYEVDDAGTRCDWATVLVHEPPHRLVLDWYPGQTPAEATRVEITFTPTGPGCRLRLEHGGWGPEDRDRHRNYDAGWDVVLDRLPATVTA